MHSYVDRIVADRWVDNFCFEDEISMPTADDVDCAIDSLDARIRTMVTLYGHDGAYLSIGGGAGQYVVYASTQNGRLMNLIGRDDASSDVVLINAGGQEGDFPIRQIVDKSQAVQAAQDFVKNEKSNSLRWEDN